jgi:hypothetical protein
MSSILAFNIFGLMCSIMIRRCFSGIYLYHEKGIYEVYGLCAPIQVSSSNTSQVFVNSYCTCKMFLSYQVSSMVGVSIKALFTFCIYKGWSVRNINWLDLMNRGPEKEIRLHSIELLNKCCIGSEVKMIYWPACHDSPEKLALQKENISTSYEYKL